HSFRLVIMGYNDSPRLVTASMKESAVAEFGGLSDRRSASAVLTIGFVWLAALIVVSPSLRRTRTTLWLAAAIVLPAAAGSALFLSSYPRLLWDAIHYYDLARQIWRLGLFSFASEIRTYGYPLFLALLTGRGGSPPETTRLIVFGAQLSILIGVA